MNRVSARSVVLYGPPASGKSTITGCLEALDQKFMLFPRLKAGPGRRAGYRVTTLAHIDTLLAKDEIIWSNERYGAVYAIDREHLYEMLHEGAIPVLHAGQRSAVRAIIDALPNVRVTRVSLTCPRNVAVERIVARATGDVGERLAAYDATKPLSDADILIDTSITDPPDAAMLIARWCLDQERILRCD